MTDETPAPGKEPLFNSRREFGSMEVAEAAGIAYQTLHRWMTADPPAVTPSISGAKGTGTRCIWSPTDLDVLTDIATVECFVEAALPYGLVRRLWQAGHRDPDADVLELDRGSVTLTVDRRERRATAASNIRRGLED